MKADSVLIIAHKFMPQMDDEYVLYLNSLKHPNVVQILHSFSDALDRKSYYRWYKQGVLYKEVHTEDYKGIPEPLIYAKEMFYTIYWVITLGITFEVSICMDGLCAFFGNILRFLGKIKRTVYWAVDFVPENRFGSALQTKIYHFINTLGYKNADEMWDLSPRMAEAREKFLNVKISDYRKHKVVPYGMWTRLIAKHSYEDCEQKTMVFMGHMMPKQGVQLALQALPLIIKQIPDIKFTIVGGGSYKPEVEKLAKQLGVDQYCNFTGVIKDNRDLEKVVAKACVALAPYVKKLDTWTYYADPGKVKSYLACGVPVLLTDIPWIVSDVVNHKCGMVITEEPEDICAKVIELMNPALNREYRKNAVAYAESFNYDNIFNNLDI